MIIGIAYYKEPDGKFTACAMGGDKSIMDYTDDSALKAIGGLVCLLVTNYYPLSILYVTEYTGEKHL